MKNLPGRALVLVSLMVLSACSTLSHGGSQPTEPGQGAFGALAEVVELLNRDPNTDWSKVNIDGLREHLVDMNALVLNARVSSQFENDRATFSVTGEGGTQRAITAMVPAHAKTLPESQGWAVETEKISGGVKMIIRVPPTDAGRQAQSIQRIRALGFFGIMALGSHHQMHHLQMASGQRGVHHH
ncbi:MAG: hypothetical protein WBD34_12060 [Burkholderiaceae bacterium]